MNRYRSHEEPASMPGIRGGTLVNLYASQGERETPEATGLSRTQRAGLALGAVSALIAAGLVWLTVAGDLSATGRRIAELEHTRQELKLRRAHALSAHALVTDPARLEERARELGFRPPDHVEFLSADPAILGRAPEILPHSPLSVLTARERQVTPTQPDADGVVERLLSVNARPAAAEEAGRQDGARP